MTINLTLRTNDTPEATTVAKISYELNGRKAMAETLEAMAGLGYGHDTFVGMTLVSWTVVDGMPVVLATQNVEEFEGDNGDDDMETFIYHTLMSKTIRPLLSSSEIGNCNGMMMGAVDPVWTR